MKAIVCVKQVPDTQGKVAVKADGTMDRAAMATITNPDDLNAVEAALALKDELGCKVIAFTMGPPPAEGMLRELMAMGVDEGVLITAREFGGSDTYATSQIIAAGIDTYGVEEDDIILAGLASASRGKLKVVGKPFTQEYYGVGIKKGDTQLATKINNAIVDMIQDGSWENAISDNTKGTNYTPDVRYNPPIPDEGEEA